MRGHDDSIFGATQAETLKAVHANKEFHISQDLLVVTTPLQGCESECGKYIIKPPVTQFYTPPGHATHTSITYDIQRNRIIFFKDSWRVACNGIKKEGELYAILNHMCICNVPHCSASGDVGKGIYHSTCTSQFANAPLAPTTIKHEFTPHQPPPQNLDDIGKRLETFQCSKDMVCAVLAALIGAYPAIFIFVDLLTNCFQLITMPTINAGSFIATSAPTTSY